MKHWQITNKILTTPYGIMCDENAANQLAIEKVFGKDSLARVVTCQ